MLPLGIDALRSSLCIRAPNPDDPRRDETPIYLMGYIPPNGSNVTYVDCRGLQGEQFGNFWTEASVAQDATETNIVPSPVSFMSTSPGKYPIHLIYANGRELSWRPDLNLANRRFST